MRSGFGKKVMELRVAKGMSQKEFAEVSGIALARVSNIEYQRTAINDDVVGAYIHTLKCTGEEAHELRKLANFSNSVRKSPSNNPAVSPLQAMLTEFGENLKPESLKQIQQIIERETGEELAILNFSSNTAKSKTGVVSRSRKRPDLGTKRFVEICLVAEEVRNRVCSETEKLDIGRALDILCIQERDLDYRILESMPAAFEGAFAAISGHVNGHTILLEEFRLKSALSGVYFGRHAVSHEISHHFLHSQLLDSDAEMFLAPQELSKNNTRSASGVDRIEQVVNTLVEVEAECFATFFLVPWTAFLKGTSADFLARDYGEQPREVERYWPYMQLQAVRDEFRRILWSQGKRKHPIFSVHP